MKHSFIPIAIAGSFLAGVFLSPQRYSVDSIRSRPTMTDHLLGRLWTLRGYNWELEGIGDPPVPAGFVEVSQ